MRKPSQNGFSKWLAGALEKSVYRSHLLKTYFYNVSSSHFRLRDNTMKMIITRTTVTVPRSLRLFLVLRVSYC